MTDNVDMYKLVEGLNPKTHMGITVILKSLGYTLLTDFFGDAPFPGTNSPVGILDWRKIAMVRPFQFSKKSGFQTLLIPEGHFPMNRIFLLPST